MLNLMWDIVVSELVPSDNLEHNNMDSMYQYCSARFNIADFVRQPIEIS